MSKFLKQFSWKSGRQHKKLPEDIMLHDARDVDDADVKSLQNTLLTFKLKYLGSTVVEKVQHSSHMSADAVKRIQEKLKNAKKNKNSETATIRRVNLTISPHGLCVYDAKSNEEVFKVSIYRISNCCTSPQHSQIFTFLSTDGHETTECHAFLCGRKKKIAAQTVALAVASAFNVAYEQWRLQQTPIIQEMQQQQQQQSTTFSVIESVQPIIVNQVSEQLLIDLDEDDDETLNEIDHNAIWTADNIANTWVSFENDGIDLIS